MELRELIVTKMAGHSSKLVSVHPEVALSSTEVMRSICGLTDQVSHFGQMIRALSQPEMFFLSDEA